MSPFGNDGVMGSVIATGIETGPVLSTPSPVSPGPCLR